MESPGGYGGEASGVNTCEAAGGDGGQTCLCDGGSGAICGVCFRYAG